jgi:hypothetical protein
MYVAADPKKVGGKATHAKALTQRRQRHLGDDIAEHEVMHTHTHTHACTHRHTHTHIHTHKYANTHT